MNYQQLQQAVQSAAGLRLRLRLQPLYGAGEIVFPCTVAGGKYQISNRRIPGYDQSVACAILDSVQSQANRMEDALLADIRAGTLKLPYLETDFTGINELEKPIGKITCFEAPHRIFDAILRDSVDDNNVHFPLTKRGQEVIKANAKNATAIFQVSPASLLFGSWDSTGISGGLGEKYARCVVSEVVGINVERSEREGFRIDPLNIAKAASPKEIQKKAADQMWASLSASGKKLDDPSGILHGNVPWSGKDKKSGEMHGGITVDYIQQSTTISFPALRQLHFLVKDKDQSPFARAVLAAIALHAAALNVERGWHLRSRCDLVLDDGVSTDWEILGGAAPSKEPFTAVATRKLLDDAITEAKKVGFQWEDGPIKLTPSPALRDLVIKSQQVQRATAPTAE